MNPQEWAILDRLKEPSSWSGIAAFLVGVGVVIPTPWIQPIAMIGAGIATMLGILLKEKS